MGTRASNMIVNFCVIPICGLKLRKDKGGNRIVTTAHSLRNLCLKEEELRLRGGKLASHEQEISAKTATVAEIA